MIFCQEFKSIIDLLTHNGTVLISTRDTILYVRQNNFMSDDFLLNLFVIIKEDAYRYTMTFDIVEMSFDLRTSTYIIWTENLFFDLKTVITKHFIKTHTWHEHKSRHCCLTCVSILFYTFDRTISCPMTSSWTFLWS
jgi:hypothetical protein